MAIGITDDIIQSGLLDIWPNQYSLLLLQCIIECNILLSQHVDGVDVDVVQRNGALALSIGIDAVIEQERVVVDDAATVKALDEEVFFEILEVMCYLHNA